MGKRCRQGERNWTVNGDNHQRPIGDMLRRSGCGAENWLFNLLELQIKKNIFSHAKHYSSGGFASCTSLSIVRFYQHHIAAIIPPPAPIISASTFLPQHPSILPCKMHLETSSSNSRSFTVTARVLPSTVSLFPPSVAP